MGKRPEIRDRENIVSCRSDFSLNACNFIKNHSYKYYDEFWYSYGKEHESYFVYMNSENGTTMSVETFKMNFYNKRDILNKKLKKLKMFKRLFCKHHYLFVRNIHGDEINYTNRRSVWKCKYCNKVKMFKLYITPERNKRDILNKKLKKIK